MLENETQRNHQIVLSAMENQFNTDMFNRTVEFKKQVAAGAASQRLLQDAISFGTKILTTQADLGGGEKQSVIGLTLSSIFGGGDTSASGAGDDTTLGLLTGAADFAAGVNDLDDVI